MLFSSQAFGRSALALALLALIPIAGAWGFQYAGHPPCDLCYEQRYAYYIGIPLALLVAAGASVNAPRTLLIAGLALFGLAFLYNAGLAIYHSGVEAKLWAGPTACTGSMAGSSGDDLLKQLETIKVVRCDEVELAGVWFVAGELERVHFAGARVSRRRDDFSGAAGAAQEQTALWLNCHDKRNEDQPPCGASASRPTSGLILKPAKWAPKRSAWTPTLRQDGFTHSTSLGSKLHGEATPRPREHRRWYFAR